MIIVTFSSFCSDADYRQKCGLFAFLEGQAGKAVVIAPLNLYFQLEMWSATLIASQVGVDVPPELKQQLQFLISLIEGNGPAVKPDMA